MVVILNKNDISWYTSSGIYIYISFRPSACPPSVTVGALRILHNSDCLKLHLATTIRWNDEHVEASIVRKTPERGRTAQVSYVIEQVHYSEFQVTAVATVALWARRNRPERIWAKQEGSGTGMNVDGCLRQPTVRQLLLSARFIHLASNRLNSSESVPESGRLLSLWLWLAEWV